jgi:hypothetical protein
MMAPQSFEGWTAACIRQIGDLAFSQVKSEQWTFINSSACGSFRFSTVMEFNETSGSGMTAECLSRFSDTNVIGGCAGLMGPFVASIDLPAFRSLTAGCISKAPDGAFSKITLDQFAAITPASCKGFTSNQAKNFPPTSALAIKSDCLAEFSATSDGLGGCSGLQWQFVGQMTPTAFKGFSKDCVYVGGDDMFFGINGTQLSYIPAVAFQGLKRLQVTGLSAWEGASVSQLSNLTNDGFTGFEPSSLKIVINMYKLELVNIFTVEQTDDYPQQFAVEFKSFIPAQVAYMTEWDTVSQDLSKVTWLKIALLKKGDQQSQAVQGPVFNAETLKMLPFSAYEGLRADHVPLIAAADFKVLNESHTSYFTNDIVSALSVDQLREISPKAFSAISWVGMTGFNPQLISVITDEQIRAMTQFQIGALNCTQLQGFSTFQLVQFNAEQQKSFDSNVRIDFHFGAGCETY